MSTFVSDAVEFESAREKQNEFKLVSFRGNMLLFFKVFLRKEKTFRTTRQCSVATARAKTDRRHIFSTK